MLVVGVVEPERLANGLEIAFAAGIAGPGAGGY